jgi:hypothetical protein
LRLKQNTTRVTSARIQAINGAVLAAGQMAAIVGMVDCSDLQSVTWPVMHGRERAGCGIPEEDRCQRDREQFP